MPGEYLAPIIPTAPGAYTFHLKGKIRSQAVDLTVTSSDSTFDSVISPSGIQFPVPLPAMGDVVTRLDRVDARIATAQAAATAAASKADDASSAASRSMTIGLAAGGAGMLVALVALVVAIRRRPPATG
jgi:exosome complex RNA-binding protein Csl4